MPIQYSDMFTKAFSLTLGFEGEYVNDPHDAGGETKYGISKASYPDEDIANLTLERAMELAHRDYWAPLMLDLIGNPPIAFELFDTAYNCGSHMAVRILQGSLRVLGEFVIIDGIMGPQTVNAVNNFKHKQDLLKMMNVLQGMYYLLGASSVQQVVNMIAQRLPYSKKYLRGWMKRVDL